MDKDPVIESEVEYVDAEPIGDEPAAPVSSRPHVRTYYQTSSGCGPCCGPIGCSVLLMIGLYLFTSADILRPLLYAVAIFITISFLAGILSRKRF